MAVFLIVGFMAGWTVHGFSVAKVALNRMSDSQAGAVLARLEGEGPESLRLPEGESVPGPETISAKSSREPLNSQQTVAPKAEGDASQNVVVSIPADVWREVLRLSSVPPNGVGPLIDGVPHGEWTVQNAQSETTAKGTYVLGQRVGVWHYFDKHGTEIQYGEIRGDKRVGLWSYWDAEKGTWHRVDMPQE